MSDFITKFDELLKKRKYSHRTIESYSHWPKRLKEHYPRTEFDLISSTQLSNFFKRLQKSLKAESVRQASCSLKLFYREIIHDAELAELCPRVKGKVIKVSDIPSQEDILLVIDSVKSPKLKLLFQCVYGMGLEMQEARTLRYRDFNFKHKKLEFISQRSKKFRTVPVPSVVHDALSIEEHSEDEYVFTVLKGNPVSDTVIQRAWRDARQVAGKSREMTVRSLRHAYVEHLEFLGIRLLDILENLGIQKAQSIRYYAAIYQSSGQLDFSPLDKVISKSNQLKVEPYISEHRIMQITQLSSPCFDTTKLLQLLKELNVASQSNSLLTVALLVRAVIDHIPPLLGFQTFNEVVNNYKSTKSFKKNMETLNKNLRNIADGFLHSTIREKEDLPQPQQVDFRSHLDQLLGEVVRIS